MTRVMEMSMALLMLVPLVILKGGALAQPGTREEIIAHLANDGPSRGSDKAQVTLIEFSDFQCSFCRRFWKKTLPLIEERYIKTGKVKFVYRHFAILGKPSKAAAQAAECAGEQGKFWEYHDKLFASAGSPFAFTRGRLKGYARELGLEDKVFNQCLDSGKYSRRVDGETSIAASLGARGTPAFFLNGRLMVGAQPFEVFEAVIEKELKKASASGKTKR
jgi:protein-disulfide isomerase